MALPSWIEGFPIEYYSIYIFTIVHCDTIHHYTATIRHQYEYDCRGIFSFCYFPFFFIHLSISAIVPFVFFFFLFCLKMHWSRWTWWPSRARFQAFQAAVSSDRTIPLDRVQLSIINSWNRLNHGKHSNKLQGSLSFRELHQSRSGTCHWWCYLALIRLLAATIRSKSRSSWRAGSARSSTNWRRPALLSFFNMCPDVQSIIVWIGAPFPVITLAKSMILVQRSWRSCWLSIQLCDPPFRYPTTWLMI